MDKPPFPASPIAAALFTPDGIDALSECIRTIHAVVDRPGLPYPAYWTYDPAGSVLSELRTTLADDDRVVLEIPLPIRFACITHDGPDVSTPPAQCRLFPHEGTIWTAQELLETNPENVPALEATRRWLQRLDETPHLPIII